MCCSLVLFIIYFELAAVVLLSIRLHTQNEMLNKGEDDYRKAVGLNTSLTAFYRCLNAPVTFLRAKI